MRLMKAHGLQQFCTQSKRTHIVAFVDYICVRANQIIISSQPEVISQRTRIQHHSLENYFWFYGLKRTRKGMTIYS